MLRSLDAFVGTEAVNKALHGLSSGLVSPRRLGWAGSPHRFILLRWGELKDLVFGFAPDDVVLLVYDHFLLVFNISYDVHLVTHWPVNWLLVGLLVYEAELSLLLLNYHLLILQSLFFGLLKYIIVFGVYLVLEKVLVRVLIFHQH